MVGRKIPAWWAIIAIISLLAIYTLASPSFLSATGMGFTTLSVDEISVQSNNPNLDGEVLQIITEVDGSGRSATGTFSQDAFSTVKLANEFTISQEVNYSKCQFQTQTNSFKVKDWQVVAKSSENKNPNCALATIGGSCNCGTKIGYTVLTGQVSSASRSDYYGYCRSTCSCPAYKSTDVGELHDIESSTSYDYGVITTLSTGGNNYEVFLTKEQKEATIEGMYARLLSAGVGEVSCPVPSANYVAWRPANTNNFVLKHKSIAQNVITYCSNIITYQQVAVCQQAIASMKASSTSNEFYYCENPTFDGTMTKMWCEPTTPPVIPRTEILIKADTIGVVIPVGEPEIIKVETQTCEASENCYLTATIKNKGTDPDSFDIALEGTKGTAIREFLKAGEQKTVQIQYSLAGVIETFDLVMTSVNDPARKAIKEVSIEVYPFCDKNPPSANHIRVMTEYGCEWVCPNEVLYDNLFMGWGENIFEQDCNEVEYSDENYLSDAHTSWIENSSGEYEEQTTFLTIDTYKDEVKEKYGTSAKHCIAENKYMSLSNYVGDEMEFIPAYREHQVWLSAPFCKYVMEYGYKMENGVPVKITEGYTFFTKSVPEGIEVEAGTVEPTTGSGFIPTTQTGSLSIPIELLLLAIVAIGILGAGYFVVLKKKRRR